MPPDDQNQGQGAPTLTPAQRDEITSLLGSTVNNMLTARLKTFEKQLHEKLGPTMAETLKPQLEEFAKTLRATPPPDDEGKGGGKRSKGEDVELATMRKQLNDLQAARERAEAEAAKQRELNRANTTKQNVAEALSGHGIEGSRFKGAYAMLQSDGRIRDDGENVYFVDENGAEVDLAIGLKAWAKTDEAKIFLPPTGARGAGSRPGGYSPRPGERLTPEQIKTNVFNALAEKLK